METQRIKINEARCNGCGLCVNACQEGALQLVDGKAKLIRADHCDGLGRCLPLCPIDAISFEPVDVVASVGDDAHIVPEYTADTLGTPGCMAGEVSGTLSPATGGVDTPKPATGGLTPPLHCSTVEHAGAGMSCPHHSDSALKQWPIQIQLVNPGAPFFQNAHLLIAADCAAFAYRNFHEDYIRGRTLVIGCPKLDDADYAEKLAQILVKNDIQSITVVRMEVPCCAGIVGAAEEALKRCGKTIPWQVVTLSLDGRVLEGEWLNSAADCAGNS